MPTPRKRSVSPPARPSRLTKADRRVIADADNPDAWDKPIHVPAATGLAVIKTADLVRYLLDIANGTPVTESDAREVVKQSADRLTALQEFVVYLSTVDNDAIDRMMSRWDEVQPALRVIGEAMGKGGTLLTYDVVLPHSQEARKRAIRGITNPIDSAGVGHLATAIKPAEKIRTGTPKGSHTRKATR